MARSINEFLEHLAEKLSRVPLEVLIWGFRVCALFTADDTYSVTIKAEFEINISGDWMVTASVLHKDGTEIACNECLSECADLDDMYVSDDLYDGVMTPYPAPFYEFVSVTMTAYDSADNGTPVRIEALVKAIEKATEMQIELEEENEDSE